MRIRLFRISAGLIALCAVIFTMVKIIYPFCLIRDTGQVNGQLLCCDGQIRRWHPNTLPVAITINSSGSLQAPGEATANAVRRAMQTWNDAPSSFFEFSDAGLTEQNFPSGGDGINVVVFDTAGVNFAVGTSTLAFSRTMTVTDELGFRAIDSDMVFNARDFIWNNNPVGANDFDIESLTLHEFGHHLGLNHAGGPRDIPGGTTGCGPLINAAVMWFSGPPGAIQRTLHPDDIAGITQIYPTWTLEGVVTDPNGGGLTNALIRFNGTTVSADTIAVTEVRTDEFGLFNAPVINSSFTISVSSFGFEAQQLEVEFLTPGSQFEFFQLQVLPTSTLQGVVRDQTTGQGIAAQIELFAGGKVFQKVSTDANGNYEFSDIPITDSLSTVYEKFRIEPDLPYPVVEITEEVIIQEGVPTVLDFELLPADVLLVDDDGGDTFESF